MTYYRTCPHCGAHLDPGERCDCRDNEKTAPRAANTQSGKREQDSQSLVSATSVHETGQLVKGGGFGPVQARRLADMMTPGQRRDVLLAARVVQETEAKNKGGLFGLFRRRRPAGQLTPGQRRDILLLAYVIQEASAYER